VGASYGDSDDGGGSGAEMVESWAGHFFSCA
jgi:hypothetical protein